MSSIPACTLLCLLPALTLSTRKSYEDLEKQQKGVFMERSNFYQQLPKPSGKLAEIKENHQSFENNAAPSDVGKLSDRVETSRKEMRALQETFLKQLNEASEKADKQQATVSFLKAEMERKKKMIQDLQNENKSLKNKLMSGNKLCGLRAEESKKIQAQLKELQFGKKDFISKVQQLTDLEQKLSVAKDVLEQASLDEKSQLKALKETVQLCLSSVLHIQPPAMNVIPSEARVRSASSDSSTSRVPSQKTNTERQRNSLSSIQDHLTESTIKDDMNCNSHKAGEICRVRHDNSTLLNKRVELESSIQKMHGPPFIKSEKKNPSEKHLKNAENLSDHGRNNTIK
ncbi:leucine zipper protein 2-like [Discoglossus pictus]